MKIGKRNGKRKKKGNSQLAGPGGFRPSERGRARGHGQAAQPAHGGAARRGRTSWVRAHASARGGGNSVERATEGGRTGRARPRVRFATVLRREPGFAMEEWWRCTGGGRGSWG
jgi:hypothetical protein